MGLAAKWAARMAWTCGRRLSQERRGLRQLAILEALVELLAEGQRRRAILPLRVIAVLPSVALFSCGAMITGMGQD